MSIKFLRIIKKSFILISCFFSLSVFAGGMMIEPQSSAEPDWILTAGFGYAKFSNMFEEQGQTALARLAIAHGLLVSHLFSIGLEAGVQTGHDMQLGVPQNILDLLGGTPLQSTVDPMLDLLVTLKKSFQHCALFLEGKGGAAYRRWQFIGRNSINDLSQVSCELQGGVGFQLNTHTSLNFLYQHIFGNNPHLSVDSINSTAHVSNIPSQNGALLTLSITV